MRRALLCVILAALTVAQTPDPLSVTLSNGKVITFSTLEQKEKFENARAAQAAQAARAQQAADALAAKATATAKPERDQQLGHTALDDKPSGSGVVNVAAPTFTADYYMLAPDTWVGKPVTLSVAYLTPGTEGESKDGLRKLEAYTWGNAASVSDQRSGGTFTIVAPSSVAMRLMQQCGTHLQYLGWTYKTTLIKGNFTDFKKAGASGFASSRYGLTIEK